jgi:CRP-like cAMP-binding protein
LAESVLEIFGLAKLQRLSNVIISAKFEEGQVIYEVQDVSQSFYVVREGVVNIEAYVTVEESKRWPVSYHAWQLNQLSRKFRVQLKECKSGDVFGLADLPDKKGRKTRAIAITAATCFIINLHQFLELFTRRDLDQLLHCEELRLPHAHELVEQVHADLNSVVEKRDSMLKAYNLTDDKFMSRDWLVDKVSLCRNPAE